MEVSVSSGLKYFLVMLLVVAPMAAGSCVCDSLDHPQREMLMTPAAHRDGRPSVTFVKASGESRGLNYKRPAGSSKIFKQPLRKSQLEIGERNLLDATCQSEQVHITLGEGDNSVVVSFASRSSSIPSSVELYSQSSGSSGTIFWGSSSSYSELIDVTSFLYSPAMGDPMSSKDAVVKLENTAPWAFDPVTLEHWANYKLVTSPYTGLAQYNNPYMYYDSPVLHTVTVSGLVPGETYEYRVGGSCELFTFVFPGRVEGESMYPFRMGLTADVGQTNVSVASMNALAALDPDIILLAGDLSYADGWPALWDTFGNTFQSLASEYPVLTTGGNHEVGSGEAWLSYRERYPTPYQSSGSSFFCYWGKEVGPVHLIALCSYAGFEANSLQYAWLQNYLATAINRERTPWLIVMMHTPLYSSNNGHWMEGELMRRSMEDLLYSAGVDAVLAGHVHSYERTYPTYQSKRNICGASYLNLGDGGNYEGPYAGWRMEPDTPDGAPLWSAFREASFGVGGLEILNSTHAMYAWHRHACGSNTPGQAGMDFSEDCVTPGDQSAQAMLTVDNGWISRPPSSVCPNRWYSSPDSNTEFSSGKSSNVDNQIVGFNSQPSTTTSPLVIPLMVAVLILGIVNVGLVAFIVLSRRKLTESPMKYDAIDQELQNSLLTQQTPISL